jgi:hypothetical protein
VVVAVLRPELLSLAGNGLLDGAGSAGLDLLPPHPRKGSDTVAAVATRAANSAKVAPVVASTAPVGLEVPALLRVDMQD